MDQHLEENLGVLISALYLSRSILSEGGRTIWVVTMLMRCLGLTGMDCGIVDL